MPIYSYTSDDGRTVELMMTLSEKEEREDDNKCIEIDGVVFKRDIASDLRNGGVSSGEGGWPMYSEAAACHPSQIKEYSDHARSAGVPTEFDRMGRPKFENASHRRRYLKIRGLRDLNGYD